MVIGEKQNKTVSRQTLL